MITLTYQYKLKTTQHQEAGINQIIDVCKSVYNNPLREQKYCSSSRKLPINSCSLFYEYIIPADATYPNYKNQAKT